MNYNPFQFKFKKKENFLSIIIPVYNDPKGLKITLSSLKKILPDNKHEIIVVNDGANKNIASIAKNFRTNLVSISPNCGSYFARNRGIEYSKGEFIAFLDANIEVTHDWYDKGIESIKKYDYIGGKIVIDDSNINTITKLFEFKTAFLVKNYLEKNHYAPTTNLLIKRNIIKKIGGFNEKLKSGGDFEFGNRVYRNNFKQYYNPKMIVIHPPRDLKEKIKKMKRISKGEKKLKNIHPKLSNHFKFHFKYILPPRLSTIKTDKNFDFSFLEKFFGFWGLKLCNFYYKYIYKSFIKNRNTCKSFSKPKIKYYKNY